MPVRITVGGSNRVWWAEARRSVEAETAPEALMPLLNGTEGEVNVDAQEWQVILAWAQAFDGWTESDGQVQLTAEFDEGNR